MSNIRLQGNPSGTGTLTIASPNTNSDFTLNLPASGGTVLLDGATQSPTFNAVTATSVATTSVATTSATTTTLAVNGNNISAVNSLGFRNRIINGDMRIDQRNAGASVTLNGANDVYPVDRFGAYEFTDGTMTAQQSSVAPAGFTNSVVFTTTSADTSLGSTQRCTAFQRIEGFNVADFGFGTVNASAVTLSFWVRSSLTGAFGASIIGASYGRSYPFTYTISAANTWEQKTVTIPGDTSGTWLTTNGVGLVVLFNLGSGSNYVGTANAWQTGEFNTPPGTTSVIGTLNATWQITGVQLEAGSVATPFERRDYGRELMMCQRYFEKSYAVQTAPGTATFAGGRSSSGIAGTTTTGYMIDSCAFVVPKRAVPTVTYYDHSGNAGKVTVSALGSPEVANQTALGVNSTNETVIGVLRDIGGSAANAMIWHFTASAEL